MERLKRLIEGRDLIVAPVALNAIMKKQVSNAKYCVVSGLVVSFVLGAFAVSAWAAATRTKIIIVVPHRILFTVALPVYIAQEKGFYRENNVDVDAVFTRGGGENVQAVVSGDAQIGLGTGTLAVISAFVKKAPIKIAGAEITGMDAFWYVQSNTPIHKIEDLAGKKVAYSRPGSSSHMAVMGLLAASLLIPSGRSYADNPGKTMGIVTVIMTHL